MTNRLAPHPTGSPARLHQEGLRHPVDPTPPDLRNDHHLHTRRERQTLRQSQSVALLDGIRRHHGQCINTLTVSDIGEIHFWFKPNTSASLIFIRIDLSECISNIISVAVRQEND